ncbi:MAG: D-alanyl-D-alanine carboxypeptidase/D-alanyl-D-alanine-endopeptidase [Dysgonamonadaceae bacterium]|nr:D-alanyl-D-alanine carboxypeptidase/D-alanyl-D-alanine-endopeptidase [Dysgonamonadaceae bacterium]MDD4728155.1 D-alanyl-D-alanine carboxypeptidase/D-alanyl-D-alanine-endopeptidase [Dysgonamonadaceae bacterium]
MKRILFIFIAFTSFHIVSSQPALQQLLQNPALKHASIGICVKDINTGQSIISYNEDKSLTPASVMKLVTTASALEMFGPDYRYKTTLVLDANDTSTLLVVGSGDPTLGTLAFKENPYSFLMDWSQALETTLMSIKNLKIYVVDNLFGYSGISNEWTWIDMGNYYAAGAYGISVFDNSYRLFFDTTDKNKSPRILCTEPEIKELTFTNYLKLNTTGRDNGYIYGAPFSYKRILRGNIPAGRTEFSIKGDIPDPGLMLGELLAAELNKKGVRVSKIETAQLDYISGINTASRTNGQNYRVGQKLHIHQSRPLSDLLCEVNVESNNHYAEHLIRTIGRKQNSDIYSDALEEGVKYVNKYWTQQNISTTSLFLHDGCGLAPQNAASPEFFCDLLMYMHNKSKYAKEFYASLPTAGHDGTLKHFMKGTKYDGKIRAKSGSIGGVQCFAGYLIDGNKKYAFTIMINKFSGSRSAVRKGIEGFIESL